MITEYHRPKSIDEALELLKRPNAHPLSGGTILSRPRAEPIEVVDLQNLGLNRIEKKGAEIHAGATTTLQELLESDLCPAALKIAIQHEAPLNLRNSASLAGTLATADGRSTFTTAALALDPKLEMLGTSDSKRDNESYSLGEYLLLRPRGLITKIILALPMFAFEYVARTPADTPIVCTALAKWKAGRLRLTLGGYGKLPLLALDGDSAPGKTPSGSDAEVDALTAAARNVYHDANDVWATAEYRMDVAATLARRCFEALQRS